MGLSGVDFKGKLRADCAKHSGGFRYATLIVIRNGFT